MTYEKLSLITVNSTISVDDQEFSIVSIETIQLASGDRVKWFWAEDGAWLVVDNDAHELIALTPIEEGEFEEDDEFVTFRSTSYDLQYEDSAEVEEIDDGADKDIVEVKHYENEAGEIIRMIERASSGEYFWFSGKMITEDDVREA